MVKHYRPVRGVAVAGETQPAAVGQNDSEWDGASGGVRHGRKYGRGGWLAATLPPDL